MGSQLPGPRSARAWMSYLGRRGFDLRALILESDREQIHTVPHVLPPTA